MLQRLNQGLPRGLDASHWQMFIVMLALFIQRRQGHSVSLERGQKGFWALPSITSSVVGWEAWGSWKRGLTRKCRPLESP